MTAREVKWWVLGAVVLAALGGATVRSFILKQRAIGALEVRLDSERNRRDSIEQRLRLTEDSLAAAQRRAAAADSAAARALRRALMAERKFLAVAARVDTVYAGLPDSALVPVGELRAVRDEGVSALNACVVARDSLRVADSTFRSACAEHERKATLQEERANSLARELKLEQDRPPAYRLEWRGAVVGAVLLWLAERLGLLPR